MKYIRPQFPIISKLAKLTYHNNWAPRRAWRVASWRRTRSRPRRPGAPDRSDRSRACARTCRPPRPRTWTTHPCHSRPNPSGLCRGPTTADRTADPGQARPSVALCVWSVPSIGDRGWGRRDSRISSRRR